MTCLIWRQHRGQALWTIVTVTVLCLLIVNFGFSAEHWLAGYHSWLRQLAAAGCPPTTAHRGVFHVHSPATCLASKTVTRAACRPPSHLTTTSRSCCLSTACPPRS